MYITHTRTFYSLINSHNSAVNVGQLLQAYASNFHEPWKGLSEALETYQTTERPGQSESYNTLQGLTRSFGDVSNNWMTRTIGELQHLGREWWYGDWQTGGYQTICELHDSHNGTLRQEQRGLKTERRHQTTSDHMKEFNFWHFKQHSASWKNKKSLGSDGDTKKCWHTWAIEQYVNSNHNWSSCTLLQIWREAIMVSIFWSDFDKRHKWKPHIAHVEGKTW